MDNLIETLGDLFTLGNYVYLSFSDMNKWGMNTEQKGYFPLNFSGEPAGHVFWEDGHMESMKDRYEILEVYLKKDQAKINLVAKLYDTQIEIKRKGSLIGIPIEGFLRSLDHTMLSYVIK